jgi:hypothetical protein
MVEEHTRPHGRRNEGGVSMNDEDLANLLANCGIIQHAAVEDPEGYDGERTMENVHRFNERFMERLNEQIFCTPPQPEEKRT